MRVFERFALSLPLKKAVSYGGLLRREWERGLISPALVCLRPLRVLCVVDYRGKHSTTRLTDKPSTVGDRRSEASVSQYMSLPLPSII